ncbi:precorrin-6A synthase (deacetylating) [Mycolicibacter longobardus]|uniref:precorrin-6A synthase (deacetylating) n=1 Tax=Mycolicibacter longobardus TaxID=1108812 RepID=UPI001A995600|nr:precorrin-6A synthase (deacetylating) [Mycolicibacter longobardus]MCV7383586.1 precorrin-6A synthase (deacetylating) [Mycolicibacter longobardus]
MTVRVRILGVGMGPQHVTPEVADALRSADYVLAPDKGADDGLLALRRDIVDTHAPSVPIVTVTDPPRDRSPELTGTDYVRAVADWHAARAARYAEVLRERGGVAAFLVWGDPALYDSTIRIVEQVKALGVELDCDVLPGISAPHLLAARHRIVLHEVGRPVHITTGRRLAQAVAAGQDNIVAMLNPDGLDLSEVADWTIWWGANLGAAGERLVSGRVSDVVDEIGAARRAAKADAGWVMDVLLVRRP